jgi:phosphatidylglycerophosphate synthase
VGLQALDDVKGGPQPLLAVALGAGSARIWGMTGAERLRRMFVRARLEPATEAEARAASPERGVLLARADWVFDESLIVAMAKRPGSVLVNGDGQAVAAHVTGGQAAAAVEALKDGAEIALPGVQRLDPSELAYNSALRKREPPVLEPLSEANVRAVEARTFKGSYKGVTDLVTKYVWPTPARIVTRWCALARITPNQVTFAGFLLVIAAFWLFWIGEFGWGLVAGWLMTFLDTVDGKLARVTMTSSKWGNIFDHGIDLVHPPFWWWAWFVGVQQATTHPVPWPEVVLGVILVGYVVQRGLEGIFMRLFGMHVHAWRPFDSFFRLITARRNPNLILLTLSVFAGRPDIGIVAVAVWTAASLVVHFVQILQGLATPRGQVVSWMSR